MSSPIFSENWYRVSGLRPRLRSHGLIRRHQYRGRDWYVLQDQLSGRYHRLSPQAYLVVGLMNGRQTLQAIWQAACKQLGDEMPTQDEVIGLLARLHQADLLQADIPPDIADLYRRLTRERSNKLLAVLLSPMSVRFPLFDPDRLLNSLKLPARLIFAWPGALLWLLVMVAALVLAGIHWQELTGDLTDRVLATENLVILWFVYPLVKILHELGHGCAVKRWGGEVHETGIMLLVLMPIPYVDASASLSFPEKWRRILVSGAGILVELFLAAVAILVWVNVEPGLVRSVAFNVVLIAGVSTILFNGNPLLRFDGYYIFSDLVEIPNLGGRSNRFLAYLAKRFLLGLPELKNPADTPGEAFWLAIYGPAAFIYRILVSLRIALFVAAKFFLFGVLLAIWTMFNLLVIPLYRLVKTICTDPELILHKGRIAALAVLFTGTVAAGLLLVPAPYFTLAEGVVRTPDQGVVYAGGEGIVTEIVAEPGRWVEAGAPLIRCVNPEIPTEVAAARARLVEYQVRLQEALVRDRTGAKIIQEEVERIAGEVARLVEKRDALLISSPATGNFLLIEADNLVGRLVRQGQPLGYVADQDRMVVQVVVPQEEVDRVRQDTVRVLARRSGDLARELPARISRQVPAASRDLPGLALSLEGGGRIALDPKEKGRPTAFSSLFHFEVVLPGTRLERIDERVYVRFEHTPEPLAFRWYRDLRRLLLARFEV